MSSITASLSRLTMKHHSYSHFIPNPELVKSCLLFPASVPSLLALSRGSACHRKPNMCVPEFGLWALGARHSCGGLLQLVKEQGWKANEVGWGHPTAESRVPKKPQGAWLPWAPSLGAYPSPTRPKEPDSFSHVSAPLPAPLSHHLFIRCS